MIASRRLKSLKKKHTRQLLVLWSRLSLIETVFRATDLKIEKGILHTIAIEIYRDGY